VMWSSRREVHGGNTLWAHLARGPGLTSCMAQRGWLSTTCGGILHVTRCVDHEEVQGNKGHDTWSLRAAACS
jgi:hypothetical protein